MRKYIKLLIIVIFFLNACGVPKHIRNDFTILYDTTKTRLDSLLNIEGYYTAIKPYLKREYKTVWAEEYIEVQDTLYATYIFFHDNLFVTNFSSSKPKKVIEEFYMIKYDTTMQLNRIFNNSYFWGTYKIKGDTIITQGINNPCPPKVWGASESKYLILSKNKIIQISRKTMGKYPKYDKERWEQEDKKRHYLPANFIPVPTLPKSDTWLKNKKWFWKNEEDYYKWKKNR